MPQTETNTLVAQLEELLKNPKKLQDRVQTKKAWGYEDCIANGKLYCGKVLVMEEGWQTSKHMHPIKDETMLVIDGSIMVELWEDGAEKPPRMMLLHSADTPSLRIMPKTYHRMSTAMGTQAVIVEFSTQHKDTDVVRLEDSRPLQTTKQKQVIQ